SRLVSFEEAEGLDEPVVGYVGYDYISKLEPTVPLPAEGPDAAESRLVVAERLVRFDHVTSTAEVLAGDRDEIAQALSRPAADPATYRPARSHAPKRSPSRTEHEARVQRAKDYIRAGDAFQIVLSQRVVRRTEASAVALYRALRRINPSPYLFLLELGDIA